jgi:hypothetical protein
MVCYEPLNEAVAGMGAELGCTLCTYPRSSGVLHDEAHYMCDRAQFWCGSDCVIAKARVLCMTCELASIFVQGM